MQYNFTETSGAYTVVFQGSFTFSDYKIFRDLLDRMQSCGGKQFVFNFEKLEFIDSAALGQLLIAHEDAQRFGWSVTIREPRGMVKRSLDAASFDRFFPIKQ